VASAAELVYVSNEDSGDLSVISTATNEVLATIPVGKRPRGVRVTPDGRTVYVALSGSPKCPPWMSDEDCEAQVTDKSLDGIAVVDASERRLVRVLPGGSDPEQFDITPSGDTLFVSNEDSHEASLVDVASGEILRTVPVGEEPEGVRVSPDGRLVYVTGETDHNVTVLDAATADEVARIRVGHRPRDAVFSSDSSRAYVSSEIDGTVSVIDVAASTVIGTIALPEASRTMGVALSPDDRILYVTNGRSQTLAAIDLESDEVVASVEVGPRPWGIGLTGDGSRLFTANGPSNDVSVIDAETFEVVAKIAVGQSPWGVAVGPDPTGTGRAPSN
jgi:YVTN family beta-propeller protein